MRCHPMVASGTIQKEDTMDPDAFIAWERTLPGTVNMKIIVLLLRESILHCQFAYPDKSRKISNEKHHRHQYPVGFAQPRHRAFRI